MPCNHHLYAVDALSKSDAWAAGEAGTITRWDRQSWQPTPILANLRAIDMLSPTEGRAAGMGADVDHEDDLPAALIVALQRKHHPAITVA